jgi:hypothetical protein
VTAVVRGLAAGRVTGTQRWNLLQPCPGVCASGVLDRVGRPPLQDATRSEARTGRGYSSLSGGLWLRGARFKPG